MKANAARSMSAQKKNVLVAEAGVTAARETHIQSLVELQKRRLELELWQLTSDKYCHVMGYTKISQTAPIPPYACAFTMPSHSIPPPIMDMPTKHKTPIDNLQTISPALPYAKLAKTVKADAIAKAAAAGTKYGMPLNWVTQLLKTEMFKSRKTRKRKIVSLLQWTKRRAHSAKKMSHFCIFHI